MEARAAGGSRQGHGRRRFIPSLTPDAGTTVPPIHHGHGHTSSSEWHLATSLKRTFTDDVLEGGHTGVMTWNPDGIMYEVSSMFDNPPKRIDGPGGTVLPLSSAFLLASSRLAASAEIGTDNKKPQDGQRDFLGLE